MNTSRFLVTLDIKIEFQENLIMVKAGNFLMPKLFPSLLSLIFTNWMFALSASSSMISMSGQWMWKHYQGVIFTFEDDLASLTVSCIPVDGNRRIRNIHKSTQSFLESVLDIVRPVHDRNIPTLVMMLLFYPGDIFYWTVLICLSSVQPMGKAVGCSNVRNMEKQLFLQKDAPYMNTASDLQQGMKSTRKWKRRW